MTKIEVINKLQKGEKFQTAIWNYQTKSWHKGADMDVINVSGIPYLRTVSDAVKTDNLANVLLIDDLM